MDGQKEELGPGRRIIRDIDGKFLRSELDSETAREMGAKRKGGKAALEQRDALLASRGLKADSDPALTALADIAIAGRSGAVSALRYFDILTGRVSPGTGIEPPAPGEACPVCGHVNAIQLDLSDETIAYIGLLLFDGDNPAVVAQVKAWLEERENAQAEHDNTTPNTEVV